MSLHAAVEILGVGLATPVGLSRRAAAAAIRAGVCRFRASDLLNKDLQPLVLSQVAPEHLPKLSPALPAGPATEARDRMVALGGLALAEACAGCPEPPPVLIALPDEPPGAPDADGAAFLRALAIQAGVAVDAPRSRFYRQGGAAGLVALRDALALLASGAPCVLVGGVDSFVDPERLERLDAEGRLLGASKDGFVPGEGAAFLALAPVNARRSSGPRAVARVAGVGLGTERGHRYSSEPYRGDGLAEAFRNLLEPLGSDEDPVRCVCAGFNGESLPAKEWGVAYLRNAERFAEGFAVEHPADCIGDAGAALGPILLGLAALALEDGHREGPCLVWSTSDREVRGAALLRAAR
jgi:3-oxoacyl-[acyl-carrier-protein] synthase I